ncbi:hypothetical protein HII31_00597 [Pseudocercospora fuligena]|uniref:Uncharacterized protein n=1 Tax=Pseudocercospora fuligena TaxID=685502 RepID=A0A8H6RTQ9_9PEZI|nr:hypothetical protein HII31_00597 [Pseudocercospora fuligena]
MIPEVEDTTWLLADTPEKKAELDLRRLAFEALEIQQEVRLDRRRRFKIRAFCSRYGLTYDATEIGSQSEFAQSPPGEREYDIWVVFGPCKEDVLRRSGQIVRTYRDGLRYVELHEGTPRERIKTENFEVDSSPEPTRKTYWQSSETVPPSSSATEVSDMPNDAKGWTSGPNASSWTVVKSESGASPE